MNHHDPLSASIAELILIRSVIRRAQRAAHLHIMLARLRALRTHRDHIDCRRLGLLWLALAIPYPAALAAALLIVPWPEAGAPAAIAAIGGAYAIYTTLRFLRRARTVAATCPVCHPPSS